MVQRQLSRIRRSVPGSVPGSLLHIVAGIVCRFIAGLDYGNAPPSGVPVNCDSKWRHLAKSNITRWLLQNYKKMIIKRLSSKSVQSNISSSNCHFGCDSNDYNKNIVIYPNLSCPIVSRIGMDGLALAYLSGSGLACWM